MNKQRYNSPWQWLPTLYVAEALPYVAVNSITCLMYVQLGISMTQMAFFTGWLYLPWVIKPFWSPFVDIIGTKRKWILMMQFIMAIGFACVAFMLPTSIFFATTLALFWIIAFCSSTHDIAADGYYMLELSEHYQAAFVGVRSTFYRIGTLLGSGGLVWVAGKIEEQGIGLNYAWSAVFWILALFFLFVALWHCRMLPKAIADTPHKNKTVGEILRNFIHVFKTFFTKPHIITALCFMLLYRLPEALCIKIIQPFLTGSRETGALGMSTSDVGLAYGILGVIALLLGGIVGGIAISRGGLKKWLWPMALSLTLPCVLYSVLAMTMPLPQGMGLIWINLSIFIEQFGYGFGFTAFMLYLIYFSEGEMKTSHYAFCTAFMALGMMLPGMAAGWLWEKLGEFNILGMSSAPQAYINFFWVVVLASIATFIVCLCVKINPHFGKKNQNED